MLFHIDKISILYAIVGLKSLIRRIVPIRNEAERIADFTLYVASPLVQYDAACAKVAVRTAASHGKHYNKEATLYEHCTYIAVRCEI